MAIYIIPLLLVLFSCGQPTTERIVSPQGGGRTGDPQDPDISVPTGTFDSYVKSFEALYGFRVTTPISFVSSLEVPEALAVCRVSLDTGERSIEVVKSSFVALEKEDRQQAEYIVFHELGHCELGRPHTSQKLKQDLTAPFSIMFPTFPRPFATYLRYKTHYLGELFGKPQLVPTGPDSLTDPFDGVCHL